ncbi:MAG: hypothetical protein AB7V32_04840 [Candidatus Berkiella sp.]
MKRSHLGLVVLVVLCASFWVVATHPMFEKSAVQLEETQKGALHGS